METKIIMTMFFIISLSVYAKSTLDIALEKYEGKAGISEIK